MVIPFRTLALFSPPAIRWTVTHEMASSPAGMAYADRDIPAGSVFKYHDGEWSEPGLGGRTTAVFRARSAWQRSDYDSFWGPAIHWNTHIDRYVVVMSHACCGNEWPQEGIYVTFNGDLSEPAGWTSPTRLLRSIPWRPGFYPQVIGTGPQETDTTVGQTGRFYLHGRSQWEIVFQRSEEVAQQPAPADPDPPAGIDQFPVELP
jgi:hypothetical protein